MSEIGLDITGSCSSHVHTREIEKMMEWLLEKLDAKAEVLQEKANVKI